MARRQLGTAESLGDDAARKTYVDAIVNPRSFAAVTAATATLSADTTYLVDATSNAIALTLPTSPLNRTVIELTRIDSAFSNAVTLVPGGTNTLAGSNPFTVRPGMGIRLIYRNSTSTWHQIGQVINNLSSVLGPTSSNALPPSIVARDSSGRSQFSDPAAAQDAATKSYVDTQALSVLPISAAVTASAGIWYRADASTGAFTVTLPSAPRDGANVLVENVGTANIVSYIRGGTDTIEGSTSTLPLSIGEFVELTYRAATGIWYQRRFLWNATAGTQVRRDASGRTQFADPAASGDAATKNYVDGVVHAVTANYTAVNRDIVLADASSGPITITIPIAAGTQVTVKKMDGTTNAVTVAPASGTIDGDASAVITGVDTSAVFIGDGTNAYVESVYEVSPSTTAITPTVITDWNSANTPGDYYGASATNGPATATYIGTVYQGVGADTALVQIVYRLSTLDAPEQWMRQWSSTGGWRSWKRTWDDTGTITSGVLTAATGATISSYTFRRVGKQVTFYLVGTYPAITVSAGGNITNTSLATITDTRFTPASTSSLSSGATGDIAAFVTVSGSNLIQVTAFPPGHASITSGTAYSCGGTYIAAN